MSTFDANPYSSLDEDHQPPHYTEDEEDSVYSYDAEAEWEESKEQLNALFSLVIFPFVGRWLGKKFSFWIWSRYMGSKIPFMTRYSLVVPMIQSAKAIA
ncbi:uncharacterized protein B0P05DRAFT_520857 [Gilbertella persicaria]|uniref:uncharacterized protein n=1 Tax=Gilbertella persicaria TaxID=101096 RepID=UPI00221F3D92|nr:uncharacterized protein B0P05DRAFT_520857 [Gilbertella persicaria]KAI8098196.1 hypothetical protein B0P05DRAFT_520857 [Gilbertella persicaria]